MKSLGPARAAVLARTAPTHDILSCHPNANGERQPFAPADQDKVAILVILGSQKQRSQQQASARPRVLILWLTLVARTFLMTAYICLPRWRRNGDGLSTPWNPKNVNAIFVSAAKFCDKNKKLVWRPLFLEQLVLALEGPRSDAWTQPPVRNRQRSGRPLTLEQHVASFDVVLKQLRDAL